MIIAEVTISMGVTNHEGDYSAIFSTSDSVDNVFGSSDNIKRIFLLSCFFFKFEIFLLCLCYKMIIFLFRFFNCINFYELRQYFSQIASGLSFFVIVILHEWK